MDNKKIIGLSLFSIAIIGVYFYLKNKSDIIAESNTIDALNKEKESAELSVKLDSVNEKLSDEKTTEEKYAIALADTAKKLDEIAPKLKRNVIFAKEYKALLAPFDIKISIGVNKSGVTIFPKHEDVVKIISSKISQKGFNLLANYEIEKKTK